eukprot:186060-Chlamydomonas_euryale.AAC.1
MAAGPPRRFLMAPPLRPRRGRCRALLLPNPPAHFAFCPLADLSPDGTADGSATRRLNPRGALGAQRRAATPPRSLRRAPLRHAPPARPPATRRLRTARQPGPLDAASLPPCGVLLAVTQVGLPD